MKVKVPVPVKMIITKNSKLNLVSEIENAMRNIKLELEQLQFQQKKLLNEAQKKGAEAVRIVQDRLGYEHKRRKEKLDQLIIQLEQIEKLEEGDEILHSTVESEIEINIGDSWEDNISEIILRDGIVVDIRKGGS